ncbi:hypothetical protein [Herbiconiux sp.]|uniref:hypothetical protein n=1 Tax=Herbiconiux sp. TaxID=1871186 RepID=UPI0025C1E62E|nr:hypothetical protein [Herbiconiux sp.]
MRIRNTTEQTSPTRRSGRHWYISAGVLLAAAGVFAMSACASTTASSDSVPAATSAAGAPAGGLPGGGGTSGEIAAITGTTLQVQDTDSQTAVTYSDSTTITQTVAAALSDVTAGVCVTTVSGGFGGAGAPGSSSTDSSSTDAASTAATSVTISAATDGTCTTGFGGAGGFAAGGGTPPTDFPDGAMPTDVPDGVMPTGAPDGSSGAGAAGFGGFASGLVTAVSGTTITVQTTSADGTTSTTDVTVDGTTTYSTTKTADASALVVGACVLAQGESDSSGTVAATSLAVSEAGDSGCSTGFGAGPGGQRPGGTGSGTSTSGS